MRDVNNIPSTFTLRFGREGEHKHKATIVKSVTVIILIFMQWNQIQC